jgi:hypothetical protein
MNKLIYFIILLPFLSCNNDDSDDCNDVFCTQDFRTIVVSIQDSDSDPIALDSFEVVIIGTGIDITRNVNESEFEIMKQHGTYPLFGDEYQQSYANREVELNFKGIINNQIIVNKDFTVGANCCHINLVSGNTSIIID